MILTCISSHSVVSQQLDQEHLPLGTPHTLSLSCFSYLYYNISPVRLSKRQDFQPLLSPHLFRVPGADVQSPHFSGDILPLVAQDGSCSGPREDLGGHSVKLGVHRVCDSSQCPHQETVTVRRKATHRDGLRTGEGIYTVS